MLDLFQIDSNFLDISSAIFGFRTFETVNGISKIWCYTHFVQNCRRLFTGSLGFQSTSAQSHGAIHLINLSASPMALSNLRCTGRQDLSCSQNVLAPLKAMRVF